MGQCYFYPEFFLRNIQDTNDYLDLFMMIIGLNNYLYLLN